MVGQSFEKLSLACLTFIVTFSCAQPCAAGGLSYLQGAEFSVPLKNYEMLQEHELEEFVSLTQGRVAFVNVPLIKEDFPQIKNFEQTDIIQLFAENFLFISVPQLANQAANSLVPHDPNRVRKAIRPKKDYGRGAIFPLGHLTIRMEDQREIVELDSFHGLVDVKGVGGRVPPQLASHRTGLMPLSEAIQECLFAEIVDHLLRLASRGQLHSTRCYGVLDLGFDARNLDGTTEPAGAMLRRSCRRGDHRNDDETLDYLIDQGERIEKTLQFFGISAARDIQTCSNTDYVMDFGTYGVYPDGSFIFSLAKPCPSVRLPFDLFGTLDNTDEARRNSPFRKSLVSAARHIRAEPDAQLARRYLNRYMVEDRLEPLFRRWESLSK